jgi:hypothetical protein
MAAGGRAAEAAFGLTGREGLGVTGVTAGTTGRGFGATAACGSGAGGGEDVFSAKKAAAPAARRAARMMAGNMIDLRAGGGAGRFRPGGALGMFSFIIWQLAD